MLSQPDPRFDLALLSRIEDAGLNASAPPQQRWVDGWLVRFSPGKAKRARCINAVAEGRLPLPRRLQECAAVYDQARLPLIVRITPFTQPPALDQVLAEQGLRRFDDTRVMALAQLPTDLPPLPAGASILSLGLEAFAQRVGAFRESPLAHRQAHAERLAYSPVPYFAYELRDDEGQPVACGQFALERDLVGLYDIYTAPHARGRGWAGLLCRHLLARAAARGARHGYLQVEGDNHAARAVYQRIGFADGYAYHYRTTDPVNA